MIRFPETTAIERRDMIEVYNNLYVGSQADEEAIHSQVGWFFIHACKEPYHRQALGYTGRGAPKGHPEYLIARRPGRLILNLVDADDMTYIPKQVIRLAVEEIHQQISSNKVLVNCNQGHSRSPTIAFLYMLKYAETFHTKSLDEALSAFRSIYTAYSPARGMGDFVKASWRDFIQSR